MLVDYDRTNTPVQASSGATCRGQIKPILSTFTGIGDRCFRTRGELFAQDDLAKTFAASILDHVGSSSNSWVSFGQKKSSDVDATASVTSGGRIRSSAELDTHMPHPNHVGVFVDLNSRRPPVA